MADVFISYKSERRAAAEHLADILEDHGYSVWFDYALATGASFSEQIAKELEAAKCVVVLWCSLSVDSIWVKREASYALDRGKLCPAFIEHVELPFPFHHEQTINLRNWDGAPRPGQPSNLLNEIARHTGEDPQPDKKVLLRAEKAWRRFGAQPLAQFTLGQVIAEQESEPAFGNEPPKTSPSKPKAIPAREPAIETALLNSPDTPSARAWAKVKGSGDLHDFDDFLRAFPNSPEAGACERARAELAKLKDAEEKVQARKDAFTALPRDEYDVTVFDRFIEAHQGTEEAFEAARLRRECLGRYKAIVSDEDTREQWELDAAVKILTGQPIPEARQPLLEKLIISAFKGDLDERLKSSGVDLSEIYTDPNVETWQREFVISNITTVAGLKGLKLLHIGNTRISDLSPISDLTSLNLLNLSGSWVSDLSPIANLENLAELYCHSTKVSDISPLANLSNLVQLSLGETQVRELTHIEGLEKLEMLQCAATEVSDLAPLSGLTKLTELYLFKTRVSDLTPIAGLTELTDLYFSHTQVSCLEPLSDLSKLQVLDCSGTRIDNLAPLANLKNLVELMCSGIQVTDWSPVDHIDCVIGRPDDWVRKPKRD